ncbi:cytochrome P450 78A5-like [Cynara cardunculus var. scolymus]|uniref:Cytochrome P450 n=1 Tax=Cynara cardunculus var. scolymus TaxID=59895 RepID=A0A103XVZ6_CYNCS|nr:cytochrome P450 78A5-like [Cynara cardunculus var. scolymus]KVH97831.1 cytochrome P450 [Cynara cardunculus var. scolymus]
MKMRPNFFLLIPCFLVAFYHLSLPLLFFISLLSLLPLFVNLWLIPGGFAWRNPDLNPSKIPGPAGLPFLGILPIMGSHAHRKLAFLASSMGATRLMAFSLGATRVVITSHPEIAKEILCGSAFSDRPVKESAKLLMFERAIGFAPSGKYWRHLRRIATNHMFSPKRVLSLEGLRQRVCDEMVGNVSKEMGEKKMVEIRGILQRGSLRNVMESVFGNGLGFEKEEALGVMVKEGYELIGEFHWGDYFPIRVLDFNGVKRRCHKLTLKVKGVVGQIVEERRRDGGGINIGRNDFLSLLLSLPTEDQLSDADMVAVLWEMIFRGTDTVAILLEWIMARMVLHQDIQAKAQEEIEKQVGNHRHVQDSDIPNLVYLQAIVKEVLRLHPPGPLLSWARLATHDVHLGKFMVPAGTTAMVNMWAITHDPTIWKNPWKFRPERFMEEDVPIMGSDLRLAPFGSGRRVCPGKSLGLATVQLWLARLLQQYKWVPATAKQVDLSECLKLSLELKNPLACRAIVR